MGAPSELRLSELLAALSLVTDLGMGFPPEHAARNCLLATGLARAMDLPEQEVRDVYYTALLKHVGCTAHAHESAWWSGGNEIGAIGKAASVDFTRPREAVAHMRALARAASSGQRSRVVARLAVGGKRWGKEFARAFCEVAARIAERLELGAGVRGALNEITERWDGKGGPSGIRGEDVALPARFAQVAEQALLFHRAGGLDAALTKVRERAGRMLDPGLADAFLRHGPSLLEAISSGDPLTSVVESEPEPRALIPERDVDRVAEVFAAVVDLKSPFFQGHSSGVADLAARKPGPLSAAEWEQVRLHPYHSERILTRAPLLAPLAPFAGMHHERSDGSGYYRGVSQAALPMPARVLAAADAFRARTEDRPHRDAMSAEEAADEMRADAKAGRLDPDAVQAVFSAAGRSEAPPRRQWPAGLSDREVEVLRLLARGFTTKEVARRLFISPKTADHHVQHIYTKIGVSTRAGAALFGMEHGLLEPN